MAQLAFLANGYLSTITKALTIFKETLKIILRYIVLVEVPNVTNLQTKSKTSRVKMTGDNISQVVPEALKCGICAQLCKRGVKVNLDDFECLLKRENKVNVSS